MLTWALPAGTAPEETVAGAEKDKKGLEQRVAALESLLKHFSRKGNEVTIKGANLHFVNGLGRTDCGSEEDPIPDCPNGPGNLIVGYNESRAEFGEDDIRTGSHNIIVGSHHNFSRFGGIVVGRFNTISGDFASVSGGFVNTAGGSSSSISGGEFNSVSGAASSVSGGIGNLASGDGRLRAQAGAHRDLLDDQALCLGGLQQGQQLMVGDEVESQEVGTDPEHRHVGRSQSLRNILSPPAARFDAGVIPDGHGLIPGNTVSLTRCHDVLDPFSPPWIGGQLYQAAGMLAIGAERLRQRGLQGLEVVMSLVREWFA
jgi:hypothetical protein